MSKQLDPLGTTTPELHRFWFYIRTTEQWYAVIRECREWFGKNWRGMSKVKKKLDSRVHVGNITFARSQALPVWFEVPDPRFATWVSVKLSLQVESDAKHNAGK